MNYYLFRHVETTRPVVCGCAMLNPGWRHMKRKLNDETVLILGKKNSTLIDVDGTVLKVKPGRAVILPAGITHVGAEPITKAVSYYWLHFKQGFSFDDEIRYYLPKKIGEEEAFSVYSSASFAFEKYADSIILPQEIDLAEPKTFENLFTRILLEQNKPSFSPLVLSNLVQRLLLELYGECFKTENIESRGTATNALVHKAILLVEDELSNSNASVKFFADRLGVNPDYLGRCFKDQMNLSLWQYIARRRVELSCARLRESSDSIDKICKDCGFGSRRQFYDEFKKYTGKTPALYRGESAYIGVNTL